MLERREVRYLERRWIDAWVLVVFLEIRTVDSDPPTHADRVDGEPGRRSGRAREFTLEVAIIPLGVGAHREPPL